VFGAIFSAASPIAYVATFVAGLPLWLLARGRPLPLWIPVVTGAAGGMIVALILAPSLRGDLFSIPLGIWRGAALGAVTAAVWWRLLQNRRLGGADPA
jgi:hypothetical protein